MAGRDTFYDMTYLTARRTYRSNITTADLNGPYDANVPEIRLDVNLEKLHYDAVPQYGAGGVIVPTPPKYEVTARAYNAHLELYVLYTPGGSCDTATDIGIINGVLSQSDSRCHADIRVWAFAGPDDGLVTDRWALVREQSVVTDTLIILANIPNTKYKVTVSFINGGSVDIVEQHTI